MSASIKVVAFLSLTLSTTFAFSQDNFFRVHFRQRPPEMTIDEKTGNFTGPLIDILQIAAGKIGYRIQWRKAPFQRSYKALQIGLVDIVPRVILTEDRKAFVSYLGPIGCQQKDIVFLVRKGQKNLINRYEDLKRIKLGVKKDTAYFERFNKDSTLKKVLSLDDKNMAKMFVAKRFESMIILDVQAIEKALKDINFYNYTYANYRYVQRIGNYYGMSKKSRHIESYSEINAALLELAKSGWGKEIYKRYGIPPPVNC